MTLKKQENVSNAAMMTNMMDIETCSLGLDNVGWSEVKVAESEMKWRWTTGTDG